MGAKGLCWSLGIAAGCSSTPVMLSETASSTTTSGAHDGGTTVSSSADSSGTTMAHTSAATSPTDSTSEDGSSTTSTDHDEWRLWSNGTRLRGANVYQQDEGRDDGESEAGWGPGYTIDDFLALRQAGANVIALSVPGTYHVTRNEPWPAMASRLEQLVGWAAEADLFVVISFRTGPGRGEGDITEDGLADATVFDDEDQQAAWAQMWSSVAADYASHPHVVGYDLMVEPHDVDVQSWRSFAQDLVFAIRTVDDETPILVSPAGWGSYDALEGFEPLTDPAARLVYTVHQYEPFGYTHGGDDPSFEALEGQLSEIYGAIGVWRAEHGEVIAVGEFGFDVDGLKGTSIDFMDAQIARIEELGGAHMVWEWQAQAAGWHDFDVRSNAEYLQLMQMWWASNEVYPSLLR